MDDASVDVRSKVIAMYVVLGVATVGAWSLAFAAFATRPVLLGTALIAYTFGLRHAVDADHISAIDNVTRKLMQAGKRPVAVGFFFSLGHSTVVFALTVAIAIAAVAVNHSIPGLQSVGTLVGTIVSVSFLFVIAFLNALVFVDVYRTFGRVRRGETVAGGADDTFVSGGLLGRCYRPLMKFIGASWQMYPLGLLFGLGFDTASEVGLLGIAATQGSHGLPIYDILIFPMLFTVGMSLLDTTDGILMLGAYGWAYVKPLRKLYYNMNITLVSIAVALLVGSVEALGIIGQQGSFKGPFWDRVAGVNDNFGALGFAIVGIFIASWGISTLVYRLKGYDDHEPVARHDVPLGRIA